MSKPLSPPVSNPERIVNDDKAVGHTASLSTKFFSAKALEVRAYDKKFVA